MSYSFGYDSLGSSAPTHSHTDIDLGVSGSVSTTTLGVSGCASTMTKVVDWDWPWTIECKVGSIKPPEIGEWEVRDGKIYLYFRCLPVVRVIRVTKGILAAPTPMFIVAVKEYTIDIKEGAVIISGTFNDNEKYQLFYEIEGGCTAMEEYHFNQ